VVSNYDTRLRRILAELGIDHLWDAVIISGGWGSRALKDKAWGSLGLSQQHAVANTVSLAPFSAATPDSLHGAPAAEVRAEKPNPIIFEAACSALGLAPEACVHVGDDRRQGARRRRAGFVQLMSARQFSRGGIRRAWLPSQSCELPGRNDVFGARDAGCFAWLWGEDVSSFHEGSRCKACGACLL
jgi:hypothetical protein